MAPYESDRTAGRKAADEADDARPAGARRLATSFRSRWWGWRPRPIGLVPALADSGDPGLPKITAQQLIEKIAKSDVQQLSGTVKVSTDLGLPPGRPGGGLLASGAADGRDGGSSADPQSKLMELASGTHTLRVAADGPDKQQVSILDNAAEYSVIHNGNDVWAYDSKSNEVYHSTRPPAAEKRRGEDAPETSRPRPRSSPTRP